MKPIPKLAVFVTSAVAVIGMSTSVAADRKRPRVARDGNAIVLEYDFENPEVINNGDFDRLRIKGFKRYSKAGAPVIPVKPVEILVPSGKRIAEISSIAVDTDKLPGTYSLTHGTKPRFRHSYGEKASRRFTPTPQDSEIFSMTEFWPVKQHRLVTVQSDRGYNIAYVNLFPLQYSPYTGKVKMATRMRLIVHLVSTSPQRHAKPTRSLRRKLDRRIDNLDAVRSYNTKSSGDESIQTKDRASSSPLETGGLLLSDPTNPYYGADYKYIVLTNEFLADESNIPDKAYSFQALCASKEARGISAGVVTTEWIYANYAGTRPDGGSDDQTRIRNFLIDAYQTWGTEYALLAGDKDIIPIRIFIDTDYVAGGTEYDIPTDLYYGCVDPSHPTDPDYSFDGDGDGKYGEFNDGPDGGEVDLTAEIFTGRAAVETPSEVVNFVRKTLVYETIDDPYLNEAGTMGSYLGFGGIQEFTKPFAELIRFGSDDYVGHFTAGFESPAIANARAFNITTLYDEDWYIDNADSDYDSSKAKANDGVNWDEGSMGWDARTDLVPYLNGTDGYTTPHLLYISDHGSWNWGMVKLSTSDTNYFNCDDLGNVDNTRPFFFYDDSCHVGAFDHDDSFGEVITTMEHGAFACILNSRDGLGGEDNSLDSPSTQMTREFFHSVLGEGILELGRAHQEAKESCIWRLADLAWSRYVYLEVSLFGDPELRLRVSTDIDNCPDDPNKTKPGECGCGVLEGTCTSYALTVSNGSGADSYQAGTVVTIQADAAPSGQVFDRWVVNSGNPTIADVNGSTTTLTMPSSAVEVTATYKPDGADGLTGGCSVAASRGGRGWSMFAGLGLALLAWVRRRSVGTRRGA